MVQRIAVPALLLGLTLLFAPRAEAQLAPGDLELGVDAGAAELDENVSDDTETTFGLRGGFQISRRFGAELEYRRVSAPLEGDLSTWMGNVLYSFNPAGAFTPFAFAGAGLAQLETGGLFGETIDDKGLAYQAGVGARIFFGERFGVRLQIGALHENTFDASSTHILATAGLAIRLGR